MEGRLSDFRLDILTGLFAYLYEIFGSLFMDDEEDDDDDWGLF